MPRTSRQKSDRPKEPLFPLHYWERRTLYLTADQLRTLDARARQAWEVNDNYPIGPGDHLIQAERQGLDELPDNSPNPAGDTDLLVLADALQEQGVARVLIRYDGSGDSGGAYEVEAEPQEALLPRWVEDQLRDVAEGCCPDGYENNDGGY